MVTISVVVGKGLLLNNSVYTAIKTMVMTVLLVSVSLSVVTWVSMLRHLYMTMKIWKYTTEMEILVALLRSAPVMPVNFGFNAPRMNNIANKEPDAEPEPKVEPEEEPKSGSLSSDLHPDNLPHLTFGSGSSSSSSIPIEQLAVGRINRTTLINGREYNNVLLDMSTQELFD